MNVKREQWIDVVKGISIIMIMWGHVVKQNLQFKQFVSLFYVQIFLVISGYLFSKNKKEVSYLKSLAQKVIIPYVFFSFFAIICNLIFNIVNNQNVLYLLITDIYKTITFYRNICTLVLTFIFDIIVFIYSYK